MKEQDRSIFRSIFKKTKELETPSFVWEDVSNSRIYIAYAQKENVIETDSEFKIKVVVENETDNTAYILEILNLMPLCASAPISIANIQTTLTNYYLANLFKIV